MKRSIAALLAVLALVPSVAFAAAAAPAKAAPAPANDLPPPPPPPPPATSECYPACRGGYFCHAGQCVSACNPPCGPGDQCLANGQCVAGRYSEERREERRDWRTEEIERPPPGYHYEKHRRIGLMIGGLVPLGLGYFSSLGYGIYSATYVGYCSGPLGGTCSASQYRGAGNALYIVPVLGPIFRELAALGSTTSAYSNQWLGTDLFLTLVFTAAEGVGLLLTLLGLRTTQDLVSDREASKDSSSTFRWSLAPGAPGTPLGLSLVIAH